MNKTAIRDLGVVVLTLCLVGLLYIWVTDPAHKFNRNSITIPTDKGWYECNKKGTVWFEPMSNLPIGNKAQVCHWPIPIGAAIVQKFNKNMNYVSLLEQGYRECLLDFKYKPTPSSDPTPSEPLPDTYDYYKKRNGVWYDCFTGDQIEYCETPYPTQTPKSTPTPIIIAK